MISHEKSFKKDRPPGKAEVTDISSSPHFQLNRVADKLEELTARVTSLGVKDSKTEEEEIEYKKLKQEIHDLVEKRTTLLREINSQDWSNE